MKLRIIGKRGDIPFELSADEIDEYIKTHCYFNDIQLMEYLLDKTGNMCGIKALADEGHGYGFNYGWKEFTLKVGETYSFSHSYTFIDGPTDWSEDDYRVTLQLIEAE